MTIRLIAIDIDGTLLPSVGTTISPRNCAALRAAEAQGVEIVIATGRRQSYALPLVAPVGLKPDSTMISSNGAVTRLYSGQVMERRFLPLDISRQLCRALTGYGTMVFTFDREGPAGLVIENFQQLNGRIAKWVEANRPYLTEIQPIERAFDGGEAPIQGMLCGTVEQMRNAEERLLGQDVGRAIATHRTEYPDRDLSILDLLPLGCSKGAALAGIARLKNVGRKEIMAIGDNLNDVEMLKYAGRAVVMANASDDMLALADQYGWERTLGNDEDGVAHVIERLLRADLPGSEPREDKMIGCAQ
jgi:Cof subfamily protein (haloacid dehalogenase superfamily)